MGLFDKLKKATKENDEKVETREEHLQRVSVYTMEDRFKAGDMVGAAVILRNLLETYGEKKRKNHRQKGREFIYFILGSKHKDLKNTGYEHWKNLNKVIHTNHKTVYPYHKQNLREAMDFFTKEIKSLKQINILMEIN